MFAPLLPDTSGESRYVQSTHLIIDATEGTNHSSTESFKRNMNGTLPCNSRIMVLSRCFQHVWPYTYKILKSAFPPSKDARSRKGGSAVSRCDAQPTTKRDKQQVGSNTLTSFWMVIWEIKDKTPKHPACFFQQSWNIVVPHNSGSSSRVSSNVALTSEIG